MRKNKNKYKSEISYLAFADMTVNMLFRYAFLLMIVLVIFVSDQQTKSIEAKTEAFIIMEWNDNSNDDIDIWVRDPMGAKVDFNAPNRQGGLMTLDRDDRGNETDTQIVNGNVIRTSIRREVVSIHGILPGEYIINGYFYFRNDDVNPINVKVTVVTLDPFNQIFTRTIPFMVDSEEHTFAHIFFDDQKHVINITETPDVQLFDAPYGTHGNTNDNVHPTTGGGQ